MNAEKFGAFVASCRKEQHMTQLELAQKLQVTDKAVSRWERGKGFPDISLLVPLSEALDISVLELMHSEKMEKREERFTSEDVKGMMVKAADSPFRPRQFNPGFMVGMYRRFIHHRDLSVCSGPPGSRRTEDGRNPYAVWNRRHFTALAAYGG